MRKFLLASSTLLLLASCAGGAGQGYKLSYHDTDASRKAELSSMAARVVERRLIGLQQQDAKVILTGTEEMTVALKDPKAALALKEQLTAPFNMRIMVEAEGSEGADITSDKYGAFNETGVTEKHVEWVTARTSAEPGKGAVVVSFTPEGKVLLQRVFKENAGKVVGIFVRGLLMSKLEVAPTQDPQSITIDGIPGSELATVFSEDVNVGLHVTFQPF